MIQRFLTPLGWLNPRWFLAGFGAAFVLMSALGHLARNKDYHPQFKRFHSMISPETAYRPTVAEMCSIVRARCRKDQVLVLIAGNSINYGAGQSADKLWTDELQRLLGAGYCVINFAFKGASSVDGGVVIGEVLRNEYPQQIVVTNAAPVQPAEPGGSGGYGYLFREARGKGMLVNWAPREARLEEWNRIHEIGTSDVLCERLVNRLDEVVAFRDFWNWMSHEVVFTISVPLNPRFPHMLRAKKSFKDTDADASVLPLSQRYRPENLEMELKITRAFSEAVCERAPEGGWRVRPLEEAKFTRFASMGVPDSLKRRTIVILSQNSPHYLARLTKEERERNDFAYLAGIELWKANGYHAMTYAPGMTANDFVDRTHLVASGGRKLASAVATEVRALAATLKYLPNSP
jgi:hypothetical protein